MTEAVLLCLAVLMELRLESPHAMLATLFAMGFQNGVLVCVCVCVCVLSYESVWPRYPLWASRTVGKSSPPPPLLPRKPS
jgi:hypothetical protein